MSAQPLLFMRSRAVHLGALKGRTRLLSSCPKARGCVSWAKRWGRSGWRERGVEGSQVRRRKGSAVEAGPLGIHILDA